MPARSSQRAALGARTHPGCERLDRMRRLITPALFVAFLIGYSVQKYAAAAPPSFNTEYLGFVLFIVFVTAVIPFAVMWPASSLIKPFPSFAIVTVVGTVGLSSLAFAALWYYAISRFPNPPPLSDLIPRGIGPGLFMAAILILSRWRSQRDQARRAPAGAA